MLGLMFLKTCDNCNSTEERTFADSWTGIELCLVCVCAVAPLTTMSPQSEGDNLKSLLAEVADV